ncbi:MAG: YecA family protein [Solirubrobacteraceae bacterium]
MAYWVRANPELAAERFHQHRRHSRGLWSKRLVASGGDPLTDTPDKAEQRELDAIFGEWGTKLWCGLSMHSLVDAVEDKWEEGDELRHFYRIAHADHNETMHTTAMSLASPVITDNETNFKIDAGRSLHYVARGLYAAFWTYAHLLKITTDYFEIEGHENVQPAFERGMSLFAPIDTDVAKGTGRNDPCPCGSGAKFKRCHAR